MSSLCQLAADYRGTIPTGGVMAEEKRDGWRALWFRGLDAQPRLWTRNGMPLDGVAHIERRLADLEHAAGCKLFLDGEFQVGDSLAATKAWAEGGWRRGGTAGVLHLFDVMPEADWRTGGTDTPLHERKVMLERLFKASEPDDDDGWTWAPGSKGAPTPTAVRVMPDEWAFTESDVLDMVRRVWAAKGEGVVLKSAEAPYRRSRSDAWMKVKAENMHKWARRPTAA